MENKIGGLLCQVGSLPGMALIVHYTFLDRNYRRRLNFLPILCREQAQKTGYDYYKESLGPADYLCAAAWHRRYLRMGPRPEGLQ